MKTKLLLVMLLLACLGLLKGSFDKALAHCKAKQETNCEDKLGE